MATSSPTNSQNTGSNPDSVIVVTGAGGVVGRQVCAHLSTLGYGLRILSRNPAATQSSFPDNVSVASYEDMDSVFQGAEAVVHLAARNNDQESEFAEFQRDNVDLSLNIAQKAKQLGVGKFIYATTTKALGAGGGHYGKSKAIAERVLTKFDGEGFDVCLARLCPVYGAGTRGKIKHLQNLPLGLGKLALWLVRSLVPIVSAQRVAEGITEIIQSSDPLEETCLADPVGTWSVYGLFTAIMNFVFVICVPTILGIPCLIAALAVAFTSKGGVFFIQDRVGKKQKPFKLSKFRTMFTGTPSAGTHEVAQSYVTGVGAFLRKFKLDELPQAWNVLKRELNLIGPRPCLENQTELVKQRQRYGVFDVLPGITGFGQVAGVDMSEPLKLSIHDHRYATFRGILLDIKIALKTIRGGGFGDPVGGDTASASRDIEISAEENARNKPGKGSGPHLMTASGPKRAATDKVKSTGAQQ